jgi:hypothetical protein
MIAVTIGTTSWRQTAVLGVNEVEFTGTWVTDTDGVTSLMVWDAGLNNARVMTAGEIAAVPAQQLTATRANAVSLLTRAIGSDLEVAVLRAFLLAAVSQINVLRQAIPHPIVSITRSGTTATGTTYDPHGLTTGDQVRITGATLAAYNLLATITRLTATTFTYVVAGSPVTPAVGSMIFQRGALPLLGDIAKADVMGVMTTNLTSGSADT